MKTAVVDDIHRCTREGVAQIFAKNPVGVKAFQINLPVGSHYLFWVLFKQWQLASEFGKCEYSPKFLHFWRVLALAKMAFFGNI
jgi:hypothetical protein